MKKLLSALIVSLASVSQNASATDLIDVIALAYQNDPTFQQAQHQRNVNVEFLSQARSALFPALESSAQNALISKVRNRPNNLPSSTVVNKPHEYFVELRQPLVNVGAWMEVKRSHQIVNQANATLKAVELDLYVRSANAYFDVLEAKDFLFFTKAEVKAQRQQLTHAEQRFQVGVEPRTSVYEVKARYDAVVARELAARNELANRLEALSAITGVHHSDVVSMRSRIPLLPPNPIAIKAWDKLAIKYSYTLAAKRHDAEIAHYAVKVQNSQYIPKLNLVGTYSDRHGQPFNTSTIDTTAADVGVQVVMPVFQGGNLSSLSRQRKASYDVALADLDGTLKQVRLNVHQAYNSVLTGIGIVRADRQAVFSSKSSLESTTVAFQEGTRTILDVLDTRKDYYDNLRQLSADQYNYIRAFIELKRSAGVLSIADIKKINSWLRVKTHRQHA